MLKEGTAAPEIEATLDDGEAFSLAGFRGKKNVVLYFYPKDFTPGCTKEACAFRDSYDEVEQYDAVVVGVSTDSTESHKAFREKHELPFPLIPDPDKRIVKLYEAKGLLGLMTARMTYVIDKEGTIRKALRHDFAVGKHLPAVIDALKSIQGS
ncbi:MAG: peroxiredoxin [Chloroflexi bacterium]|nr:peroxiredoxin [Chloroflexota bacterium]MCI0849459.1 peroxiredoxin [Chloroflexota bacterium]